MECLWLPKVVCVAGSGGVLVQGCTGAVQGVCRGGAGEGCMQGLKGVQCRGGPVPGMERHSAEAWSCALQGRGFLPWRWKDCGMPQ